MPTERDLRKRPHPASRDAAISNPLRTKIVATLGPASQEPKVMAQLITAGVSVFRINFAHGDPGMHQRWIRRIRRLAKAAGRPVGILADLGGPKIRVRGLPDGRLELARGDTVDLVRTGKAEPGQIPVDEPRLLSDLAKGDPVFLADGSMELTAQGRRGDHVACRVVTGGLLIEGKGVNVPRTRLKLPSMTPKDHEDLKRVLEWGVDAVALSFVRRPQDMKPAQKLLAGTGIPLLAKIEKAEAINHLDAIVAACEGVMVARGDLGVETPLVEIPMLQKRIIRIANASAKPVITATQMLRSMVENPHPTRAEASDVANAILDGTDAVMLSEETAMGRYPVKAVETMVAIARNAESHLPSWEHGAESKDVRIPKDAVAVSHAAVELAAAVGASAIVTPTRSGATARHVSRLRPRVPILALSKVPSTLGHLLLSWGVVTASQEPKADLEAVVAAAARRLQDLGLARAGDPFVLTAGFPAGTADSNLLTVQHVPKRAADVRARKPRRATRRSRR